MGSRQLPGDISLVTIAGVDQTVELANITYSGDIDLQEASPIGRPHASSHPVKQGLTISTGLYTTISAPTRVTNLNVTGFTVDAVALITMLRGGTFSANYTLQEGSAVNDLFKWPVVTKTDFTLDGKLIIPTAALGTDNVSHVISPAWASTTIGDKNMIFSMIINGVTIALPMVIQSFTHAFTQADLVAYDITMKGQDPYTGTYPTTPTGTTTLLEKGLNDPGTAIAFALTSHASEGVAYSGNAVYSGMSFSFDDGTVITNDFTFVSQGAVTAPTN
jgi:hypothetical protein